MNEEQEIELTPDEEEVYEEAIVFSTGPSRLFGEPSTSASLYYCSRCSDDVLAQDVVWDRADQPHCPDCNSILTMP